jgi:hypothetical protein
VDAVLGLSVTPSAVGLVLVEGQDADGATMDRDAFEVGFRGRSSAVQTSEKAAAAVRRSEAIAATRGHRLHSIGVTWSDDANTEASLLLKSLNDSGFDNVVPVRLPEATDALARGIADVIGYDTTAVCVLEPETVMALIVHTRDSSVQTAVNHVIVTEEDLIRWLSGVFRRADWQPQALVIVGSGGDDELMPVLERALSVPVFAPAEAQLALARGAALASAQNFDTAFSDDAHHFANDHTRRYVEDRPVAHRRKQLAQNGPLALLVAGVLTFTVSASVAVSLQLAPKKDLVASDPQPAAKTSPETPAAATHFQPPVSVPQAPVADVSPAPAAPPVEAAPPPVDSQTPAAFPEAPVTLAEGAPPVDGVPPESVPASVGPEGAPPLPEQLAPPVAPAPVERPGIMSRIRDRLHGESDEVQPAPELAPPAPAPAPDAAPPAPAPDAAAPPAPPPADAPPLVPPPA